jgi:hypothetical protein
MVLTTASPSHWGTRINIFFMPFSPRFFEAYQKDTFSTANLLASRRKRV